MKTYSDVPWYDKVLTTDDPDLYKARDKREVVVQHIFEDYEFAAQNVQAGQPKGAIDKWIVLATMARHALYEGTYRKYHPELNLQGTADEFLRRAADAALQIMQEGGFSIYNTGNPREDYYTLFNSQDLTTNPEMIQARYYENDIAENGFWAYMFGSYIPCPTKDLVQAYLMADGSYYSSQPNYQTKQFVEEFQNRDPRIYQTLAYPGWELIYTGTYATGAGIYVQELSKNFSGYHQIKGFINSKDESYYMGIDFPVIRYAEVLLTYAEAKAELGELTQDVLNQTINVLRDRAGMPHLTMNPPADPVMQAAFPGVESTLLEIRRERRVELVFEGLRRPHALARRQAAREGAGRSLLPQPRQVRPDGRRHRGHLPHPLQRGHPRRGGQGVQCLGQEAGLLPHGHHRRPERHSLPDRRRPRQYFNHQRYGHVRGTEVLLPPRPEPRDGAESQPGSSAVRMGIGRYGTFCAPVE